MGEYATYNGDEIKIGTCENMYYLRDDQRHLVQGYDFEGYLGEFRFRFPFPDEDGIEPGAFNDHSRGVRIPTTWRMPAEWSDGHSTVQFTARAGYVLSVPCPEATSEPGFDAHSVLDGGTKLRVGRNGFCGGPEVRQQKHVDGKLVTVVYCGACGAAWRVENVGDAARIAEAFLDEAERMEWHWNSEQGQQVHDFANSAHSREFLRTMAARIMAGYGVLDDDDAVAVNALAVQRGY